MRIHFLEGNQDLHQLELGKDISSKDVRNNYNILNKEMDQVLIKINEAVDKNDYVNLLVLVDQRKRLNVAIGAIKSLYDDNVIRSSLFNRIIDVATNLKMIWLRFVQTMLKTFRILRKEK